MKNTMLKSLSLLGMSLLMSLTVSAQEPKVKVTDKEVKVKGVDYKTKDEKDSKFKANGLKEKDEKNERKVKGIVRPMRTYSIEKTELKTGETKIRTQEGVEPVNVSTTTVTEPVIQQPVATPVVAKTPAPKKTYHKRVAYNKPSTGVKYIYRTKYVRDTVMVPSPPERVVTTETNYVHDTVFVNRVDTVVRMQTKNTYAGYSVPRGNFKKVILKKTKSGDVYMKRKEEGKETKIKVE